MQTLTQQSTEVKQLDSALFLTIEQRAILAVAANRLGFIAVQVGKGIYKHILTPRDILYITLDRNKTFFTLYTKFGANEYRYKPFKESLDFAQQSII